MRSDHRAPIDVLVLTGFLGSGKTTLLNRLVTSDHSRRLALVVNEFGEISIDHDLLLAVDQPVVTMANGCICCTIAGDLAGALLKMAAQRDAFDTVVIETTGLAQPAPILKALYADESIRALFSLRGVVTMVDAKHGLRHLETTGEVREQVAFADMILVNKIDLVATDVIDDLETSLRQINRHAPVVRTRHSEIDIATVLDMPLFAQRDSAVHRALAPDSSGDGHHRHLQDMQTLSLSAEGAMHGLRLGAWLQTLIAMPQPILRIKGILNLWSDDHRFLFQAVQSDCECRPGPRWADGEARINRVVFIGPALDSAALREGFTACLAIQSEPGITLPDTFGRWHEEISPQRLDQIRFWMRQNFGFGRGVPILIKEVPCAKPQCPPIETAIVAMVERAPPRLFKVQASINDLTFDHVYDLMENPMPCC